MNAAQVGELFKALGVPIRAHLGNSIAGEVIPDAERVFEVLNALAISTATVLAGTGADQRARTFFLAALENQLDMLMAEAMAGDAIGAGRAG